MGVGATWNHLGTFLGCLFYGESSLKHCYSNITADTYGVEWRISLNALRISTGHCIDSLGFGGSLCGEYKTRPLQWLSVVWVHKVSFPLSTEDSILFLSRFPYSYRRSRWLPVQPWLGQGKNPGTKKGQVKVPDLNLFSPSSYCPDVDHPACPLASTHPSPIWT